MDEFEKQCERKKDRGFSFHSQFPITTQFALIRKMKRSFLWKLRFVSTRWQRRNVSKDIKGWRAHLDHFWPRKEGEIADAKWYKESKERSVFVVWECLWNREEKERRNGQWNRRVEWKSKNESPKLFPSFWMFPPSLSQWPPDRQPNNYFSTLQMISWYSKRGVAVIKRVAQWEEDKNVLDGIFSSFPLFNFNLTAVAVNQRLNYCRELISFLIFEWVSRYESLLNLSPLSFLWIMRARANKRFHKTECSSFLSKFISTLFI